MKEKLKYFIMKSSYDLDRCVRDKMEITAGGLVFRSEGETGVGRFITRIFDSGERGMVWHRLTIETEHCGGDDIRMTVFTSDKDEIRYGGETRGINELLHDETLSFDEKAEAFGSCVKKRLTGVSDALLHDVSGRYLWVLTEVYSSHSSPAAVKSMRIFLPASSWIDYLPQIYRKSDEGTHFLERYLGIFQTFYEELEFEIGDISRRFDPESAESDFLVWLAEWLNITDVGLWKEEKLRKLLLMSVELYRRRGTRGSLSDVIELYTGEKPFIVENAEIREFSGTKSYDSSLLPMYGSDPYKVTMMIKSEHIKSDSELSAIRRLAAKMLPAYAQLDLVVLEPYIFLDKYSYLGINSTLGKYRSAALDGRSQLTMSTIGGRDVKKEEDSGDAYDDIISDTDNAGETH